MWNGQIRAAVRFGSVRDPHGPVGGTVVRQPLGDPEGLRDVFGAIGTEPQPPVLLAMGGGHHEGGGVVGTCRGEEGAKGQQELRG